MKAKIIIIDGVIDTVLGTQDALETDLQIEVVNFDRETDSKELLDKEYEEDGMLDLPFNIKHCKK